MSGSQPFASRANARVHDPVGQSPTVPPTRRKWKRVIAAFAVLGSAAFVVPSVATQGAVNAAGAIIPGGLAVSGAVPVSSQFDVTGVITAATVDVVGDAHSGGTVTVNGQLIVVPRELVAILPATALTWEQLFAEAPAPYAPGQSGLAQSDLPKPLATYEIQVIGNRVTGKSCNRPAPAPATPGTDCYIAGLIHISQQDLNSGAGYINFIDYNVGPNHDAEMRVGGKLNDPNCVANPANLVAGGPTCSGARLRINDAPNSSSLGGSGRYGRASSPDPRFMVDQDNPTITAGTGYPMCISRSLVDPTTNLNPLTGVSPDDTDLACPLTNRVSKKDGAGFLQVGAMIDGTQPGGFATTTLSGAGLATIPGYVADATAQIPMEAGDYITYAGNLVNDTATPTVDVPGATTYISAHTIVNNFAAYTMPGTNPAYVSIEVSLVGTGGLTVFGAGEAAVRTRFEGMSTDPTRNVHVYAIDLNPIDGSTSDRDWGVVSPDPGPPGGAVMGRWRLRPPCKVTAGSPVTDKICSAPAQGNYVPPTRELRAVIDGGTGSTVSPNTLPDPQIPGFVAPQVPCTAPSVPAGICSANGITFGQFHAPIDEYIFPENIPGNPIPPNNFESMGFLAYGGYTSGGLTPTLVGQLTPWPGDVTPAVTVCASANAGGPYSVKSGDTIQLAGSAGNGVTGTVSYQWTLAGLGTLTNITTATPSYQARTAGVNVPAGSVVSATLTVNQLGATGCPASTTSTVPITILDNATLPTVSGITVAPSNTVTAGTIVSLSATSSQAGTLQFIQTSGPTVTLLTNGVNTGGAVSILANASGTVTFTAPTNGGILTFVVTLSNANGVSNPSNAATVTVTTAVPVNVVLTTVQYRTGKQRLDITATYTADATGVLKLQPYVTSTGATFNPATLGATFTNGGAGTYTITVVGAPPPACNPGGAYATPCASRPITVQAFKAVGGALEGTSAPTALTSIRR